MKVHSHSRTRRGVTLLIVVAFIVVAGLAMVSVSRRSLRLATDSVERETELQQRWGTISLQRTLLHGAPKIFLDFDKRALAGGNTETIPSTIRSEVLLGGIQFRALLADEQTKLNLNTVYHTRGRSAVELAAQNMKGLGGLKVRLTPEVDSQANRAEQTRNSLDDTAFEELERAEPPTAFRNWGQVFDLSQTAAGVSPVQLLPTATAKLTCWGRGEINIARAPDDVVEEACRTVAGPGVAKKLVAKYRADPIQSLNQIAVGLEISELQRQSLRRAVTTQSSTYSLWLTSNSLNGGQRWFAVAAPNSLGIRIERFQY